MKENRIQFQPGMSLNEFLTRYGNEGRKKGLTPKGGAKDTGLSRESLYKALSGERTPSFYTV